MMFSGIIYVVVSTTTSFFKTILLYEYSTLYLSVGSHIVSTLWLLWITLLWISVYKCLYGHVFSSLLIVNLVGLQGHMVTLYIYSFEKLMNFPMQQHHFIILPVVDEFPISSCHPKNLLLFVVFISVILSSVKWGLIVGFYFSLMTSDIEHLFMFIASL